MRRSIGRAGKDGEIVCKASTTRKTKKKNKMILTKTRQSSKRQKTTRQRDKQPTKSNILNETLTPFFRNIPPISRAPCMFNGNKEYYR